MHVFVYVCVAATAATKIEFCGCWCKTRRCNGEKNRLDKWYLAFTHWFQFGFADFCLLLILFLFVILFFLQSEQIHVPQCISVETIMGGKKRLASNRTRIEVCFFFHSRSKSLVPEGNGIDIDDCGLPLFSSTAPLPPAVWLVVKIVNVCKQMQTGTGKCFDLVYMSVCGVCVCECCGTAIWWFHLILSTLVVCR